jgi:hypothetical protein
VISRWKSFDLSTHFDSNIETPRIRDIWTNRLERVSWIDSRLETFSLLSLQYLQFLLYTAFPY